MGNAVFGWWSLCNLQMSQEISFYGVLARVAMMFPDGAMLCRQGSIENAH